MSNPATRVKVKSLAYTSSKVTRRERQPQQPERTSTPPLPRSCTITQEVVKHVIESYKQGEDVLCDQECCSVASYLYSVAVAVCPPTMLGKLVARLKSQGYMLDPRCDMLYESDNYDEVVASGLLVPDLRRTLESGRTVSAEMLNGHDCMILTPKPSGDKAEYANKLSGWLDEVEKLSESTDAVIVLSPHEVIESYRGQHWLVMSHLTKMGEISNRSLRRSKKTCNMAQCCLAMTFASANSGDLGAISAYVRKVSQLFYVPDVTCYDLVVRLCEEGQITMVKSYAGCLRSCLTTDAWDDFVARLDRVKKHGDLSVLLRDF